MGGMFFLRQGTDDYVLTKYKQSEEVKEYCSMINNETKTSLEILVSLEDWRKLLWYGSNYSQHKN